MDELFEIKKASAQKLFSIPQPKWLLEIGAMFIRTETELILKSRRVVPTKLLKAGFKFEYGGIGLALNDLVK